MSGEVVALLAGTVLAVAALAFVLYPLFFAQVSMPRGPRASMESPEASAILALREIEFDRATGKLSETDYAGLREVYAVRALRELREAKAGISPEPQDPIEARVRAYRLTHRECATCGLRPERDAVYCSTCGGYLDRVCPECRAPVTEASAVFCSSCGASLARVRQRVLA